MDHRRASTYAFIFTARLLNSVASMSLALAGAAQYVYSNLGSTYTQDFNGLGTATASPASGELEVINTALTGWSFSESGTGANTTVTAGTGSTATGDTYNFGLASNMDRTLGGLRSGSVTPLFGFRFLNNTGSTIHTLQIAYMGKTWRVGSAGRMDRLDFQYSTNAASLTTGTWTDADALDYGNPGQATGGGGVQHSASINANITGLSIIAGSTVFLRWVDMDASGADDGMGVDDISLMATGGQTLPTVGFASNGSSVNEGGNAIIHVSMGVAPSTDVVVNVTDPASGSATSGNDYTGFGTVQLIFPANGGYPSTQSVAVSSIADAIIEPSETLTLLLSVASGPASAGIASHTLTILDDDLLAITGCSSSQSPFALNVIGGVSTRSVLTTGDQVGTYKMVGDPDGLGAFDNGDGTFTLLMNHELSYNQGVTRAHGSIGAFVSRWVIDKSTLCVLSGQDLIQSVQLWNGNSFVPGTTAFTRFCSADLPATNAFFNSTTGLGSTERILMNGEEAGAEGRAFAHIVTGPNAGTSYQLPYLGRSSWENAVARPLASNKTMVGLMDDTTPGQVYFYIGTKQGAGTEIEKAGLHNGRLYGVAVTGLATESTGGFPAPGTAFTLADLGDAHNLSGAQLNTNSNAAAVTAFLRPEDGAWDPSNPADFYFTTTDAFASPSRLWRLRFTDVGQPELGGTIAAVLDGSEGQKMLDNLTIDTGGHILLQEDAGNQAHLGKLWKYDISEDALTLLAQHDPSRFLTGGANFLTQNEESSGILDMADILGPGTYLFNVMAHYSTTAELVEGGQLLLLNTGSKVVFNARVMLEGPYSTTTGSMSDALRASGLLPLSQPYTGLGYTFTAGDTGVTSASVFLNGDENNAIVDWVIVELRSSTNSGLVISSRSALLQRDGDIVGLDGLSALSMAAPDGSYHVAVRHRDHLGVMTANPVPLNALPATIDLSSPATSTYGTNARKSIAGTFPTHALWAGDVTFNGQVKYTGNGNDRDPILTTVGSTMPNSTAFIYSTRDVNMDGAVKYTGSNNDRDPILVNVGSTTPNNIRVQQLP